MSLQQRLVTLNERHSALEMRIAEEGGRPRPNETALSQLKREKLRLKEEMERLKADRALS
ncbi:YdcH family protein [Elioraea rosea]|uniref:YdcH family protein n=1 Tax=Elioraea rosea TaxID=2492390 RepID=UPI00118299DF|nr:DUF465 domain-containing protein [Elioraea rosea]